MTVDRLSDEYRRETLRRIMEMVSAKPEVIGEIISAAMLGQQQALERANEQRLVFDLAFRSALILAATKKRISPQAMENIFGPIVAALNFGGNSPIEKEAREVFAPERKNQ